MLVGPLVAEAVGLGVAVALAARVAEAPAGTLGVMLLLGAANATVPLRAEVSLSTVVPKSPVVPLMRLVTTVPESVLVPVTPSVGTTGCGIVGIGLAALTGTGTVAVAVAGESAPVEGCVAVEVGARLGDVEVGARARTAALFVK
jgi:hypothetical protein